MKILYTYLETFKRHLSLIRFDDPVIWFFILITLAFIGVEIMLCIQDEIDYKENLRIYDKKNKGDK